MARNRWPVPIDLRRLGRVLEIIVPRGERHHELTARQARLLQLIEERGSVTKSDRAASIGTGPDTALRELRRLIELRRIERDGVGKATRYRPVRD